jgi:hypothetical protein
LQILNLPKIIPPYIMKLWPFVNPKISAQIIIFSWTLACTRVRNRFYIYDFKQKKVIGQNLVTHGSCDAFEENDTKYQQARCSNRVDSHCSSSGKYKVGKRDYSSWGIKVKYWLDGLEETNDNARDRVVVLHSWEAVADEEIYPDYSPLSWGCPAVSDNFMRLLDQKLQKTQKPVLLWIVE